MLNLNYRFLAALAIPIGFTLFVFVRRQPPYPLWAKVAALLGGVAGVAWFVITLFFQPPLSFARYPFLWSVSIKQFLAGVFVGIAITIALACESRLKDGNPPEV